MARSEPETGDSVFCHGELSFLDLQEVGGVDGWGIVLDVLFS